MKRILTIALMVALAGCSNNPDTLAQNKSSATTAKSFPENYQALYRKIHDPASRCLVGSPGVATQLILDAQLYPDLGFGEISYSMSSIYGRHFFWKAKVERAGTGSKVSVVSGNSMSRNTDIRNVLRWADGETSC